MTKYREIIRLAGLGLSQTNIALSCNASKTTVNKVLKAAREQNLTWPLDPKLTDPVLCGLLFPNQKAKVTTSKRMPDYAHIRKELLRNGVNKKLLWTEYLEECRLAGDINYTSGRKLNRSLIERLATCEYITEHRNLFITGATGSGKTYLACAFGMEACRQRYKTKYVRLPDLLLELEMARNDGTYKKVQGKYANPVLLIIDEWLLLKPTESEQHDILELLHRRRRRSSTIFCSQYDSNGWYDQLGGDDSPLAEAILDRIKHDAYKINIIPTDPANYRSMREVYGLDPALSE